MVHSNSKETQSSVTFFEHLQNLFVKYEYLVYIFYAEYVLQRIILTKWYNKIIWFLCFLKSLITIKGLEK